MLINLGIKTREVLFYAGYNIDIFEIGRG